MFADMSNRVAPSPTSDDYPEDRGACSARRAMAAALRQRRATIQEGVLSAMTIRQLRETTRLKLCQKVAIHKSGGVNIANTTAGPESKFKQWRHRQKRTLVAMRATIQEVVARMELWRGSLKIIEGHHGSGVVSYFVFLKWLFLLNLFIFSIVFVFVVLPQWTSSSGGYDHVVTGNISQSRLELSNHCSDLYRVNVSSDNVGQIVIDFLQGTGWMERTVLFYGYYSNERLVISHIGTRTFHYNLPLAYILITVIYMVVSLLMMVRHTGRSLRDNTLQQRKAGQNCNAVFGGWDYSVYDDHTADLKHRGIFNQIKKDLYRVRHSERKLKRTCCKKFGLFILRVLINVCVVAILVGAGYLIYFATVKSTELLESKTTISQSLLGDNEVANTFTRLVYEYLPSLTITALNIVVPPFFYNIARGEDYSADVQLKVTIGRTVFLRLASVAMLIATLYLQVTCGETDFCDVGMPPECPQFRCWETYVGQQLYKLAVLDFITVLLVVVLVDFPRRLIVTKCPCGLSKFIGKAEFDINKTVLDLVYSQTICWMGTFFSPLIVAITVIKLFIVFYLRKINCLFNYNPPEKSFYASRSFAFFMAILIAAYLLCCAPIAFVIWKLSPSKGCGPFRIYSSMYDVTSVMVEQWPQIIRVCLVFATSPGFIVPLFFVILMILYYYRVSSNSHKDMSRMLKDQLVLESKDKQYLLAKVCALTDQANSLMCRDDPVDVGRQNKPVDVENPGDPVY